MDVKYEITTREPCAGKGRYGIAAAETVKA
jgi:hypothetical protein